MDTFTINQAYIAMYLFIEEQYQITKSDELAMMLSSMSLLQDGSTADPAMWEIWLEAVEKSKDDGSKEIVVLKLTR